MRKNPFPTYINDNIVYKLHTKTYKLHTKEKVM